MRARNIRAAYQVVAAMPGRAMLLALPVAAGVALAAASLAIDRGLSLKAQEAVQSFGTDVISVRAGQRVIAGKSGAAGTLTEEDVDALRDRLRGARAVEGTRIEDAVPTSVGGKNGVYRVFAVRPPWAAVRQFGAARGEFFDAADLDAGARVCVIGQTVARELFNGWDPVGQEILLNQVPFRVKGVLVPKGASPAEGDRDARVVVPLTTFYARLYRRLHLDQIVVQAANASPAGLASLEGQITAVLRERHRIGPGQPDDFTVRLPGRIAEDSRGVSRAVFVLLLSLAGVCVGAAALVIGLVQGQTVRARRGEIGLRRALGAMPADILRQFWAEGAAVSALGGAAGLALGLAGGWALARWRGLAFSLDPVVVVAPLTLAAAASLAVLLPARAAARLDPSAALRDQL
jgi:putative ABC transport system permease protein